MSWDVWLAFAAASTILLIIPGPTVILVVSYALSQGRSSVRATVPGVALGDFVAMTVSLAGAGAVLAASAELFAALKLAGAVYLVWMGIQLWRSRGEPDALDRRAGTVDRRRMFWNAFVVTALNPKGIVFFVAFVPQFVDQAAPVFTQFAIMEATFLVLAAVNIMLWGVLAGQLRVQFRRPATLCILQRTGGSMLIGAGLLTALSRRPT